VQKYIKTVEVIKTCLHFDLKCNNYEEKEENQVSQRYQCIYVFINFYRNNIKTQEEVINYHLIKKFEQNENYSIPLRLECLIFCQFFPFIKVPYFERKKLIKLKTVEKYKLDAKLVLKKLL